jgi:hypothetical protein
MMAGGVPPSQVDQRSSNSISRDLTVGQSSRVTL